jgi:hypothetical protein
MKNLRFYVFSRCRLSDRTVIISDLGLETQKELLANELLNWKVLGRKRQPFFHHEKCLHGRDFRN